MLNDPIADEIRRAKEEYAARFNFDLDAICDDLQKEQKKRGKLLVSFPPGRVKKTASKTAKSRE